MKGKLNQEEKAMGGGGRKRAGKKSSRVGPLGVVGWEEDEGGKVVTSQLSTGLQRESGDIFDMLCCRSILRDWRHLHLL